MCVWGARLIFPWSLSCRLFLGLILGFLKWGWAGASCCGGWRESAVPSMGKKFVEVCMCVFVYVCLCRNLLHSSVLPSTSYDDWEDLGTWPAAKMWKKQTIFDRSNTGVTSDIINYCTAFCSKAPVLMTWTPTLPCVVPELPVPAALIIVGHHNAEVLHLYVCFVWIFYFCLVTTLSMEMVWLPVKNHQFWSPQKLLEMSAGLL